MPYMFAAAVRDNFAPYVTFAQAFSPEECQRIIALKNTVKAEVATVGSEASQRTNGMKRRTEVYWLHWAAEKDWFFKRIADNVIAANNKWWGFHLSGMMEALQLTHYRDADRSFYDWHEDYGHTPGFSHRKLSVSVALTEGHEGGDFEFIHSGKVSELKLGTMLVFPSFTTHRVTPVTKGERWSLVSWIQGPPFV